MCHSINRILEIFPIKGFTSIVFMDSMIFKDRLYAKACNESFENMRTFCLCREHFSENTNKICERCNKTIAKHVWKNSILLMMPLMLGMSKIHHDYYSSFKILIENKYSIGIIGGRPKSALYIVGYKDDEIIVLDPHFVQHANASITELKRNYANYFNRDFITVRINDLESSLSVGMYFRDEEEFFDFEEYWIKNAETFKEIILIRNQTPDYLLDNFVMPEENEDGFIVL